MAAKKKISLKQKKFVEQFLSHFEVGRAAEEAGYSANHGSNLLKNPAVRKELIHRWGDLKLEGDIASPEEVLTGFTRESRFNPADLFDENSRPIPIKELPRNISEHIAQIDYKETVLKSDDFETVLSRNFVYKFPKKFESRDRLGKFHGLFKEKIEHEYSEKTLKMFLDVLSPQTREEILSRIEAQLAADGNGRNKGR